MAMRLKVITCAVLEREFALCASRSKNEIEIATLEQGLHNTPDELRRRAAEAIDQTTHHDFDAIILGYGLCSRGTVDLCAARTRLVIPRAHDCITMLLGSKEKYRQYFDAHPGVYWYSNGWINNNDQPSRARYERTLAEYTEKYGKDNAEYLMKMEQNWMTNYELATYVDWDWPESDQQKAFTQQCAREMGWSYDQLTGDPGLLQRIVDGDWRPDEVLVLEPGQAVAESFDPNVLRAKKEE